MNPDYGYSIARRARGMTRIAPDLGVDPPEWFFAAVCASMPPEIFFPEKGESTKDAKRAA